MESTLLCFLIGSNSAEATGNGCGRKGPATAHSWKPTRLKPIFIENDEKIINNPPRKALLRLRKEFRPSVLKRLCPEADSLCAKIKK